MIFWGGNGKNPTHHLFFLIESRSVARFILLWCVSVGECASEQIHVHVSVHECLYEQTHVKACVYACAHDHV